MNISLLLVLAVLAMTVVQIHAEDKSFDGYQVYEVTLTSEEQVQAIVQLSLKENLDIWSSPSLQRPTHILVSPEQKKLMTEFLRKYNLKEVITTQDLNKLILKGSASGRMGRKQSDQMTWDEFYKFEEIETWLENVNKKYPTLTDLKSIGKTHEERDIWLMTITLANSTSKPEGVLIDAGIHAREWATPPIATYIINELTENQMKYKSLLQKKTFYIIPVLNPDGYHFTFESNRMWRKNRTPNKNSECIGVDLNRNFPFQWGGASTSNDPCSNQYKGDSSCSELECKALTKFISDHSDITTYFTLHSYGQYWLYPYSYERKRPKNDAELNRIVKNGAEAIKSSFGTEYTHGSSVYVFSYAAGGVSDDWAFESRSVPYAYTLEVRDTGGYKFMLPENLILPTVQETWAGIQIGVTRDTFAGHNGKLTASGPSINGFTKMISFLTIIYTFLDAGPCSIFTDSYYYLSC